MKKRLLTILLALAMASLFAIPALAVVGKSDSYYVADYADVLEQSLEDRIIAANGDLEYYCDGAQIVVATVNYLEGAYADEYAMTLFNDWGVGSASANNGMLLLMVPGENKAWLTVGSGISGSFTSGMADDYFDEYFWDDFDSGDYNSAAEKMLDALFSWYGDYYGVNADDGYQYDDGDFYYDDEYENYGYYRGAPSFVTIMIVVFIIILVLSINSDRRRYNAYYRYYGMPIPPYHWWFMFNAARPHRTWIDPRWNNHRGGPGGHGGGGFWGGSGGSRPGSGGRSSGGGFGGFGGGGFGGFGGGGHSGSGFGGGGFGGGGGGRR